jgi:hypothetical protein
MRKTLVLGGPLLGALGVAVAGAAIPDEAGVVHACYAKGGALRVIDASAGSCGSKETPLDWNVQGPPGPAGPPGPKGDPGEPAAGRFAVVLADGTLQASSGVAAVDKVGTGSYFVTFTASVASCAAVASVRVDDAAIPSFAMISRPSETQVWVGTFTPAGGVLGAPVDEGFELAVHC